MKISTERQKVNVIWKNYKNKKLKIIYINK